MAVPISVPCNEERIGIQFHSLAAGLFVRIRPCRPLR